MTARYAAIVIVFGQQFPALVFLAGDIGLTRFTLGIQRVEVLLQTVFRAFAGIDGTAKPAHY